MSDAAQKIAALEKEIDKKEQLIGSLMRISVSSISLYDFIHQKVVHSQWWVLKRLGYNDEEFEGVSSDFFRKILHPDDLRIIQNHLEKIKIAKKDQILECVFRIRSKSGNYHWIALRDSILSWDERGEICQLIASMIDVTKYKLLKMQLDENVAMLASLSHRNSHELRAPVATILGLVKVIRQELQTEGNVQELVDILEQTIIRMDEVIHDFNEALSK
jgi:PAS domain S-box-containing protein